MKLNNKGFAITAVLYGLLILFLLLFLSTIKILNAERKRMAKIGDVVNDEIIHLNKVDFPETKINSENPYTTIYRGKYIFAISQEDVIGAKDEFYTEFFAYLPVYTTISISENKLTFKNNKGDKLNNIKIMTMDGSGPIGSNTSDMSDITSITIKEVYTSNK